MSIDVSEVRAASIIRAMIIIIMMMIIDSRGGGSFCSQECVALYLSSFIRL
jgi:hypothetical protein